MATHTTTVIPSTNDMVVSGNAIVVVFACDDDGNPGTTATCADSKGNTYASGQSVQVSGTGTGSGVRVALFVALNATALTGTDTITVTHGAVVASTAIAREYAGLVTSSALDVSNTSVQAGTNAPTTGSTGTLSQAAEAIFAAIGVEATVSALNGTSRDLTSVLSEGTSGGGATSNIGVGFQQLIVNSTAALAGGYNPSDETRDWACVVGAYKAITGGTSVGDPKIMANGTEASLTLITSNGLYTAPAVATQQYPTNPAGIGMRSSGTTADTFLNECGVLVAYDASKGPMTIFRQRRRYDVRV